MSGFGFISFLATLKISMKAYLQVTLIKELVTLRWYLQPGKQISI